MKVRILQAKASNGARLLVGALRGEGLNALRTKVQGSRYRGIPNHLIVNWGRNEYPSGWNRAATVLNRPTACLLATDKILTFKRLKEAGMSHNIPRFTEDIEDAKEFFRTGAEKVYVRRLSRGSQGRGILVAQREADLEPAPLYTEGIEVDREVRVHVWSGQVLDYAQKKRLSSDSRQERGIVGEPSEEIRNLSHGWIFARTGVEIPESCKVCAVDAVSALGLDFGAVDIVITPQGVPKVLEINTAPGLEGTTLERYKDAILQIVHGNRG